MTRRHDAYILQALAVAFLILVGQTHASRKEDSEEMKAVSHHVASIAIATKATLNRMTIKEAQQGGYAGQQQQDDKALCSVPDGLQPDVALREIERCVKQLEIIKEGTLEQGKTSWEHNNKYVTSLAGLENRMTELSRPEPFEIAFAVDQADMYEKLKNRLQAIQLDLPKLQGLPGALLETVAASKEKATQGVSATTEEKLQRIEEGQRKLVEVQQGMKDFHRIASALSEQMEEHKRNAPANDDRDADKQAEEQKFADLEKQTSKIMEWFQQLKQLKEQRDKLQAQKDEAQVVFDALSASTPKMG